jgi:hypothetical protein
MVRVGHDSTAFDSLRALRRESLCPELTAEGLAEVCADRS